MMIPIIKDKLGDSGSSDNYRSIAISSLIMKIYDLVILSVFSEYLELDDLQFGYQTEYPRRCAPGLPSKRYHTINETEAMCSVA